MTIPPQAVEAAAKAMYEQRPQASAIIAIGDKDAEALVRSDLPGVVIDFR